ncbi:calbindin-32-like protein [Leptotrombidium deliense]|uniref:Calbindin-32-like protein n=1 Tax=Leptotrombidium deliense TaxID=299467 RepID=A0A443S9N5_9ACAR|nr:calbindin-32-like protein [Leptotrombidium deliense]
MTDLKRTDFVAPEKIEDLMNDYTELRDFEECNPVIEPLKNKKMEAKRIEDNKNAFIKTFDANKNGKIEITEMTRMFPLPRSFSQFFHLTKPLYNSVEFVKLWRKYDKDKDGFINFEELKVSQDII